MSDEYKGIEDMDLGVQDDGEPTAVVPEAAPEPEPARAEAATEPEVGPEDEPKPGETETPEQIEEKKRLTGSARAKARAERAEREAAELRDRLARLEQKVTPEAVKPADPTDKPKLDDFESFEAFNEALTDWKVDQKLKAREAEAQTKQLVQSWEQKKAEARKEYEDLDEVLADMEPPNGVVLAVMAESDHTAKIAYYLGQHPDEMKRINTLAPPAAALAVARIEAQIIKPVKPEPPETKPTSKAPAPLRPVTAAPVTVTDTRFGGIEEF